jgi:hypothetical protein
MSLATEIAALHRVIGASRPAASGGARTWTNGQA